MRVWYSSNGDELLGEDILGNDDDDLGLSVLPPRRQQHMLSIDSKQAAVCSRTVTITPSWSITVWEWQSVTPVIETYWQVEQQGLQVSSGTSTSRNNRPGRRGDDDDWEGSAMRSSSSTGRQSAMLDPFGLVTWPGSVVAALELLRHRHLVKDKVVFVIGAGVGVEAQAAAALGARKVIATDVHPTTIRLLEYGVEQAFAEIDPECVETRVWDLFGTDEIPDDVDLVVCADVLYNDNLASQLIKRICPLYQTSGDEDTDDDIGNDNDELNGELGNEALSDNSSTPNDTAAGANQSAVEPLTASISRTMNNTYSESSNRAPVTLVVDSQRFCHSFEHDLNAELRKACGRRKRAAWESRYLPRFTGSGILVEEDQTYDVKARVLWIHSHDGRVGI
jgi:Lysine methyltransferase